MTWLAARDVATTLLPVVLGRFAGVADIVGKDALDQKLDARPLSTKRYWELCERSALSQTTQPSESERDPAKEPWMPCFALREPKIG